MSEHKIELDHELEQKLFLQPMWKFENKKLNQNYHMNMKTQKVRLGNGLTSHDLPIVKINLNMDMKYFCNYCGNE